MKTCLKTIQMDQEGYLKNPHAWSEKIAKEIAKKEGIVLSEIHWKIIYFIREFYFKYNISPTTSMLVRAIAQKYGEKKGKSRYLFSLFPKGPAIQATKISGIPKPEKCI